MLRLHTLLLITAASLPVACGDDGETPTTGEPNTTGAPGTTGDASTSAPTTGGTTTTDPTTGPATTGPDPSTSTTTPETSAATQISGECGDGNVDPGEECDDGNADDTDACVGACKNAKCGDGFVRAGTEECDDGNLVDLDACSNACKAASCSDKLKNGTETDVDCGGMSCGACNLGQVCKVNADCASGTCSNGKCGSGLTLPNCADDMNVTATTVFNNVIMPKCAPCHTGVGQSGGLNMKDAATLKANNVGVASTQAMIPRVTASNLDLSYFVYKILGQQAKAPGGGGSSMPLGGSLTQAQQCTVINWVKFGAK